MLDILPRYTHCRLYEYGISIYPDSRKPSLQSIASIPVGSCFMVVENTDGKKETSCTNGTYPVYLNGLIAKPLKNGGRKGIIFSH